MTPTEVTNAITAAISTSITPTWNGLITSCSGFDEVQVQFAGITGGDSFVIQGSEDGTNFITLTGVNLNSLATLTSITVDGIYSFPACGYIRYTKTGAGATPAPTLLRK